VISGRLDLAWGGGLEWGTVPSLKGHFLLAAPTLAGSVFERSVVLLVRHDADGAFGVIVNAPLPATVAEAIGEEVEAAVGVEAPLYRGGPCPGPMMMLHGHPTEESEPVVPGVHYTAARPDIERVLADRAEPTRYVFGYAGWGAAQLESELAEGSWAVLPATPADTFGPPDELWARLVARSNLTKYVRPDQIPDDPSLN